MGKRETRQSTWIRLSKISIRNAARGGNKFTEIHIGCRVCSFVGNKAKTNLMPSVFIYKLCTIMGAQISVNLECLTYIQCMCTSQHHHTAHTKLHRICISRSKRGCSHTPCKKQIKANTDEERTKKNNFLYIYIRVFNLAQHIMRKFNSSASMIALLILSRPAIFLCIYAHSSITCWTALNR